MRVYHSKMAPGTVKRPIARKKLRDIVAKNDRKEANMSPKNNSSSIFSSIKTYRFIARKNNAKNIDEQTNIQATFQHMS